MSIPRKAPLQRSSKRIPARRKGGARRGPAGIPPEQWRNPAYLAFLREEGKCGVLHCGSRRCDPAHGPVNGRGSKGPDAEAAPLCRYHHERQHALGWTKFQEAYGYDRALEAAAWWAVWLIWKEMP
jgi:hypothetical protein